MEIIEKNGVLYNIPRDRYETKELYYQRCWFIINNINKETFKKLIYLSRIWINIKYFNMTYENINIDTLKNYDIPQDVII